MSVSGIESSASAYATLFAARINEISPIQGGKAGTSGITDRGMRDAELEELKKKNPDSSRLDFAKLSEAEKLRARLMAEKGVSEDSLAQMQPDQRAKLEEDVRQKVADHVQQTTGKTVGGLANIVV
jgi:hypothetical protein